MMFDWLGFLKPVTGFFIDKFGMFGVFLSLLLAFLVIAALLLTLVIIPGIIAGICVFVKERRLKNLLKKANRLRREGNYKEAYQLYKSIWKQQDQTHIVSSFEIAMLCKECVANGGNMQQRALDWLSEHLSPFKPETYYEYGLCLMEYKENDPISSAKGVYHIEQADKLGHKEAANRAKELASKASEAMKRRDIKTAAALGNPQAQYEMYKNSRGREADEWLQLAADQKYKDAAAELGMRYVHGEGRTKDFYKAIKYFTYAAEQGDINAQAQLGWIYGQETFRGADEGEAIRWYTTAAQQGHGYSMHNLAVLYAKKMKKLAESYPDISEAVEYMLAFAQAAEQGESSDTVHNLEVLYAEKMEKLAKSYRTTDINESMQKYMDYMLEFVHWKVEAETLGILLDHPTKDS